MAKEIKIQKNGKTDGLAGRPQVITEEVATEILDMLKIGYTVEKACYFAGVGENTYYVKRREDADFDRKVNRAKEYYTELQKKIDVKSAEVIHESLESKNTKLATAKWWNEQKNAKGTGTQINILNSIQDQQGKYSFDSNE